MAELQVLNSGLYTTIQDKGRIGFREFGVPYSGAMDQFAFRLANLLLGNKEEMAVIEWAMKPPVLLFEESTLISLTGAEIEVFVNDVEVMMWRPIFMHKGDVLSFGVCKKGVYGYVGIKNGFGSEQVLESRSFYADITTKKQLGKGDVLSYIRYEVSKLQNASLKISLEDKFDERIEVFKGPEYDLLSALQKDKLLHTNFTISGKRNRMAIQLNEMFENKLSSILTSPVMPGTVQLTPSGVLMVLMRDGQTTGGYPRVLQLTSNAINKLAQRRTSETIQFILKEF